MDYKIDILDTKVDDEDVKMIVGHTGGGIKNAMFTVRLYNKKIEIYQEGSFATIDIEEANRK